MKHFVYSDPHFNHFNIIKYAERPFSTLEEMNKFMINEFNKVVSPEDKVYILGDFGMGTFESIKNIVSLLNGYKILIMGNHDRKKTRKWWLNAGFEEVHKDPILIQKLFILSHEPLDMSPDMPYFNIHGHIHQYDVPDKKHLNVSVDVINYRPLSVSKLVRMIKAKDLKEEMKGEV